MIELLKNETTNFKNFSTMKSFLGDQDARKSDRFVEFNSWEIGEDGLRIKSQKTNKWKNYMLRDSGMKTMLRLFRMPVRYYYEVAPTDMAIRDINRMRDEYDPKSEFLVFLQKEEDGKRVVRAVSRPTVGHVSNHKTMFDSIDVGKNLFEGGSYSDLGMRIVTSDDKKQIRVEKGDIINVGVDLVYSDIGLFPTAGNPYLNRLICTNGMVMKEKHPLLSNFAMSFTSRTTESQFLESLHTNFANVQADGEVLQKTFHLMKKNPISSLPDGERRVKSIRNAVGSERFDEHEKLSRKIMDSESETEKILINTDLDLYSLADIVTRMCKSQPYLERRKVESLVGSLTLAVADNFIKN
uniref:DUF932 domain-containing protein n=1 Tax=viral metagenome TaxID=1070528 RepID=A0A6M3JZC8_9ZZZZ